MFYFTKLQVPKWQLFAIGNVQCMIDCFKDKYTPVCDTEIKKCAKGYCKLLIFALITIFINYIHLWSYYQSIDTLSMFCNLLAG